MKYLMENWRKYLAESEYEEAAGANDAIEQRHPAHAIPNDEHREESIGVVLDLLSLKKKYGRSRDEHAAQRLLDRWRGPLGAGSGKKWGSWTLFLAAAGATLSVFPVVGGALMAIGLSGASLNVIHEVMAGNSADDDLKQYIQWDPEILKWMDDKIEDEIEDEWIDLLFEHISENPHDNLTTFISINDFANEKLGRTRTGEKVRIQTPRQDPFTAVPKGMPFEESINFDDKRSK